MQGDLDDIFNGTDTPVAEVEAPEVEEKGEVAQESPAPEATPAPEPQEERVPVAALIAERRQRQELQKQLEQFQRQNQAQPERPDFYADPESYVNDTLKQHTLNMSATMVEAQHPDFREKLAVFLEEANGNPILQAQLEAHPHPALFAYQQALKIESFRQMQDLPNWQAQQRAEIEKKVREELGLAQAAKAATAAAIPPDLSGARASKTTDVVAHSSIESLLKKGK